MSVSGLPAEWFIKNMKRRMLSIAFVTLVGLAGSMSDADMPKNSLYDRLGGQPAIIAMVDDFIGKVASYSRIKPLGYLFNSRAVCRCSQR